MSDGTTTTHEPINGGNGAICAVCAMRRPVMLEGFSVPIAIYTPAPWPCDAAKAEAENARLRERVAALEAAGNAMSELVVRWMESATFSDPTDWYECRDCEAEGPAPEILRHEDGCAIGRWLAALAQAGEGGAA